MRYLMRSSSRRTFSPWCRRWQWQQLQQLAVVCVTLTILLSVSVFQLNAVQALAAAASRSSGGTRSSGFGRGGGGGGANTNNKSKKQNVRKKQLQPLYMPDTSSATQDLVSFCRNVLEFEGMESGTEIGISTKSKMRGLYATDTFAPGEFILAIPFIGCLTLARDDGVNAKDEVNDAELGYRLWQRMNHEQDRDRWSPYFQSWPSCLYENEQIDGTNFDATPDFFTLDEIQALQCPILIQKAKNRKQQIQQLAAQLEEEQGGSGFVVNEHQLQFATWLVKSRGFTLLKPVRDRTVNTEPSLAVKDDTDDSSLTVMTNTEEEETSTVLSRTVLMPYLDMINHSHNPNCQLVVVETKAEDESFYAIQALQPIAKGKEITIIYGVGGKKQQREQPQGCDFSSMIELFADYGFVSSPPPVANPSQRDLNNNDDDDGLFTWTTTLKEDEQLLNELETATVQDIPLQLNMKKVLEFRIHMKRAQLQHNNKQ